MAERITQGSYNVIGKDVQNGKYNFSKEAGLSPVSSYRNSGKEGKVVWDHSAEGPLTSGS